MNRQEARKLVQSILPNGQSSLGLNEHGLGAIILGSLTVFLAHEENSLRVLVPAYVFRETPNPTIIQGAQARAKTLRYWPEHNAVGYEGRLQAVSAEQLSELIDHLAAQAQAFASEIASAG